MVMWAGTFTGVARLPTNCHMGGGLGNVHTPVQSSMSLDVSFTVLPDLLAFGDPSQHAYVRGGNSQ